MKCKSHLYKFPFISFQSRSSDCRWVSHQVVAYYWCSPFIIVLQPLRLVMTRCNLNQSLHLVSFSLAYILTFSFFPSSSFPALNLSFSGLGELLKGCERETCAEQTSDPSFSSLPHIPEKTRPLAKEKGEEKNMLEKKICNLELAFSAMCHHLFPMQASWNRRIRMECWNREVFLLRLGTGACCWGLNERGDSVWKNWRNDRISSFPSVTLFEMFLLVSLSSICCVGADSLMTFQAAWGPDWHFQHLCGQQGRF